MYHLYVKKKESNVLIESSKSYLGRCESPILGDEMLNSYYLLVVTW